MEMVRPELTRHGLSNTFPVRNKRKTSQPCRQVERKQTERKGILDGPPAPECDVKEPSWTLYRR